MIKAITIIAVLIIGIYFGVSYLISSPDVDKYLDAHPDYKWEPAFEYYIGQYNIFTGNWDKAIYRFSRVMEKYPSDEYAPPAQYALAFSYDQKGNLRQALTEYQKLIELYPDSPNDEMARKRIAVIK